MITQKRLKELLEYHTNSGHFNWRITSSNRRGEGRIAGCNSRGYIVIRLDGILYFAHRLVWLYMYGKWPDDDIDHIDHNGSNNRISNLRDVTGSVNLQNRKSATSANNIGLLGVSKHKLCDKFEASIKIEGKKKYLGLFKTPEEAHAAYLGAKRIHHEGNTL